MQGSQQPPLRHQVGIRKRQKVLQTEVVLVGGGVEGNRGRSTAQTRPRMTPIFPVLYGHLAANSAQRPLLGAEDAGVRVSCRRSEL